MLLRAVLRRRVQLHRHLPNARMPVRLASTSNSPKRTRRRRNGPGPRNSRAILNWRESSSAEHLNEVLAVLLQRRPYAASPAVVPFRFSRSSTRPNNQKARPQSLAKRLYALANSLHDLAVAADRRGNNRQVLAERRIPRSFVFKEGSVAVFPTATNSIIRALDPKNDVPWLEGVLKLEVNREPALTFTKDSSPTEVLDLTTGAPTAERLGEVLKERLLVNGDSCIVRVTNIVEAAHCFAALSQLNNDHPDLRFGVMGESNGGDWLSSQPLVSLVDTDDEAEEEDGNAVESDGHSPGKAFFLHVLTRTCKGVEAALASQSSPAVLEEFASIAEGDAHHNTQLRKKSTVEALHVFDPSTMERTGYFAPVRLPRAPNPNLTRARYLRWVAYMGRSNKHTLRVLPVHAAQPTAQKAFNHFLTYGHPPTLFIAGEEELRTAVRAVDVMQWQMTSMGIPLQLGFAASSASREEDLLRMLWKKKGMLSRWPFVEDRTMFPRGFFLDLVVADASKRKHNPNEVSQPLSVRNVPVAHLAEAFAQHLMGPRDVSVVTCRARRRSEFVSFMHALDQTTDHLLYMKPSPSSSRVPAVVSDCEVDDNYATVVAFPRVVVTKHGDQSNDTDEESDVDKFDVDSSDSDDDYGSSLMPVNEDVEQLREMRRLEPPKPTTSVSMYVTLQRRDQECERTPSLVSPRNLPVDADGVALERAPTVSPFACTALRDTSGLPDILPHEYFNYAASLDLPQPHYQGVYRLGRRVFRHMSTAFANGDPLPSMVVHCEHTSAVKTLMQSLMYATDGFKLFGDGVNFLVSVTSMQPYSKVLAAENRRILREQNEMLAEPEEDPEDPDGEIDMDDEYMVALKIEAVRAVDVPEWTEQGKLLEEVPLEVAHAELAAGDCGVVFPDTHSDEVLDYVLDMEQQVRRNRDKEPLVMLANRVPRQRHMLRYPALSADIVVAPRSVLHKPAQPSSGRLGLHSKGLAEWSNQS